MFTLTSPAFKNGESIPVRFTADGAELSPPLEWDDPPPGTESFVLIVDDPDAPDPAAPRRVWVHWIRYNLAKNDRAVAEGAGSRRATGGCADARTDAETTGYHGPCPPIGEHRYFFHLFALDTPLPALGPNAHRRDVEKAMTGHVLGEAVLMGTYACTRHKRSR